MQIDMSGMIYSLTYALDCIEAELSGVTEDHAKWVAYLSVLLGRENGLDDTALSDLAACAALHDNALTQYLAEERQCAGQNMLGVHCTMGEENARRFPFRGATEGFILYHHENVDGSGPFGKTLDETPLQAQLIHLADMLDVACHLKNVSAETYERICAYLTENRGTMFSPALVDAFFAALPEERYLALTGRDVDTLLGEMLPHRIGELPFAEVQAVMDVFGRIVDYKSPFTRNHSDQIAHKVRRMAEFYGWDETTTQRLYVAGALHDIGKMAIDNDILEKPDKLTGAEFTQMKNHAWFTYVILKRINGFDDITEWASLHHEKLNGRGYPFGKTAAQLTQKDRLLACVDIYQALSEERPYKKGLPHEKCIEMMRGMAQGGFIDADITEDIDCVFRPHGARAGKSA